MDILKLIKSRRSIRKYKDNPVSRKDMEKPRIPCTERYATWNRLSVVLTISIAVSIYLFILKSKPGIKEVVITRTQVELENVVEMKAKKYVTCVLETCRKYKTIYSVDPLLVFSIMKSESKFDEDAISYVGAAGLMQLMPEAVNKKGAFVYEPEFLQIAQNNRKKALQYRDKAYQYFIENDFAQAIRHKKLSDGYVEKADTLFKKYRVMLEKYKDRDSRFNAQFSIDTGVRILAGNLKSRNSDIREAVAAYNAGSGSVSRYDGIPPIKETVLFQNKVMNYYKDYLESLKTANK